ncbi:molt-inhibiting hormone-like [Uloborus diversus]|uniref:molt-inhibiting hormone-like n=1 Tax=Uloborus diversus TaxID=327109 RepID=UPI00240A0D16|nr:molt-inhibiting hormone-like [Uloborus diversus]
MTVPMKMTSRMCFWIMFPVVCHELWWSAEAYIAPALQYVWLGCNGTENVRSIARLSRICEECYEMFREHDLPITCRSNCYHNELFRHCVRAVEREHLIELVLTLAREVSLPTRKR